MSRDDRSIIKLIFEQLRRQCNNPILYKLIYKEFKLPYVPPNEIDIILKTQNNTLFLLEVKTHKKKSDPLEKFKEAIKQLSKDEGHIYRYNQDYQDFFNKFSSVRFSFIAVECLQTQPSL